jgi:hypothetical protein
MPSIDINGSFRTKVSGALTLRPLVNTKVEPFQATRTPANLGDTQNPVGSLFCGQISE